MYKPKKSWKKIHINQFREDIGTDAFNGFVALAECKHDIALANAREAQTSRNRDFALAGFWIEALTEQDRKRPDAARAVLPDIVREDRDVADEAEAQRQLDEFLGKMGEIRTDYDLPATCE
jgi:hypothetical protein